MNKIILIFIGGGLGSVLRYLMGNLITRVTNFRFPLSTLSVNIIASFILGFVAALLLLKPGQLEQQRLLIGVGFCGGLSTFSTFTLELFDFIKAGSYGMAFVYAVLSVIACLLAFAAAHLLLKSAL